MKPNKFLVAVGLVIMAFFAGTSYAEHPTEHPTATEHPAAPAPKSKDAKAAKTESKDQAKPEVTDEAAAELDGEAADEAADEAVQEHPTGTKATTTSKPEHPAGS